MPNDCFNHWDLSAENEDDFNALMGVLTQADDRGNEHVTFEGVMPVPEVFDNVVYGRASFDGESVTRWHLGRREDGTPVERKLTAEEEAACDATGSPDPVAWKIHNWGTFCDAYQSEVARVDACNATISFMSAWTPPDALLKNIVHQHPNVSIEGRYNEPRVGLSGTFDSDEFYQSAPEDPSDGLAQGPA